MKNRVECYAGSSNPEKPRAFTWEEKRYIVQDILQSRRSPAGIGFLVLASPGNELFDLFFLEQEEQWQILPKGSIHNQE